MTLMTTAQAEEFLYRHDTRARSLTRMTRAKLLELRAERDRAAGFTREGGAWSKDELVNHLLAGEYPTDQLNQAIHAKYHVTGQGGSSACEYCHPHGDGRCDCSPKALEAELARRAAENDCLPIELARRAAEIEQTDAEFEDTANHYPPAEMTPGF